MIIPGNRRKSLKIIRVLEDLRSIRGLSIDEANFNLASVQPGSAVGSRPVGGGSNPSDPTYIQRGIANGH